MGQALTNREIAKQLVVSVRTVEAHLAHICHKLGLRSRVEVTTWAALSSQACLPGPALPR